MEMKGMRTRSLSDSDLIVRHLEGYRDVVTHRSIREQLDTSRSIPRRQPKLPCDSHGLRLRPSNIPDLT
jgi:hypothetical protein